MKDTQHDNDNTDPWLSLSLATRRLLEKANNEETGPANQERERDAEGDKAVRLKLKIG